MDAIRIVLVCVAGAVICVTLRAQRPEMALGVAAAAGLTALFMSLGGMSEAVTAISNLAREAGIRQESSGLLIRATGIALIAEFGAQLCKDAGEGALASRIEQGGRVVLLSMSLPLLTDLTTRLTGLIP